MTRSARRAELAVVALITLAAAVLRLIEIGRVPPDPFYDAAVRSMTLSWHNFFFGAFEPGASVSIDKPPVDLWLQVISVKLLGFSSTTLKLPEALGSTAAVPLIYEALRRLWSARAGVAAAAAMAILPIDVITARSDTMDGVMMLLSVLALLLVAIALQSGRTVWLLAGAAALGVGFDVKLLESLVALPGLAVLAAAGLPGSRRRRLAQLTAAGAVYVVVALAWLTATLIAPAKDRPYAIGSTDGSAWNAAFVFNGKDRLEGKSPEAGGAVYEAGHHYPTATQEERDHIPILPPSVTRLFARIGPLSGERLGMEILLGLILGIPAMLIGIRGPPAVRQEQSDEHTTPAERPGALRIRRAAAAGLSLWLVTGFVLFSKMIRLHPRYVEGFTPAVAAILGIGLAWACSGEGRSSRARLAGLGVGLVVVVIYTERLLYGVPLVWWISLLAALGALAVALLATRRQDGQSGSAAPLGAATLGLSLIAVLAVGFKADTTAIADKISDAGFVGQLPGDIQTPLSAYLKAHQDGARYEVAAESATGIGSLIVQDAKPIVVLTTYDARVYTSVAKLQHLIAAGSVRYAFLNTFCTSYAASTNAACSAPVKWVRAHGKDVSRAAGLPQGGLLYLLPGAHP